MKKIFTLLLSTFYFLLSNVNAQTGTWTAVTNLPIHPNNGVCLLMTDGTVICKNNSGPGNGTGWDRLTPDVHGSYINGTWDTIASMYNDRLFFSSQILPSGKVYVAGGEYGAGDTAGEVYDPVANSWTRCGSIPATWNIYDGNSEILYDGTVLEGPQIGSVWSYNILLWSPVTYNYTVEPNSIYNHDEAEWLKLPDSSVLFVGINTQYGNRYIPQTGRWVYDDTTPGDLYDPYGSEAGCALMLPNGKAIFFGATPYNCIYTPSGDTNYGSWTSADSFPVINGSYMGQPDASGAMMVNGHILLACSPIGTGPSTEFLNPAYFVEYDYTTNTFTQVKAIIPGQGGDSISNIAAYQTQMLDLPDGNVLVSISQTDTLGNQYYIYTPGSGPIPQGKPTINTITPDSCRYYKITGKLFNGISEGAAYGDDWQMSTNWPLVRLTNGTNIYYAKTTNWNRIGAVQTDSLEDTAYFALPSLPGGTYSVEVVVNGFVSNPVVLTAFGVSITSHINASCNGGSNGSATALAADGTTPYTYLWSPSGGTNPTATGLSAGTYTITVTGNGGCSATTSVIITQHAMLNISASAASGCVAGNNGRVGANVTGGTLPYTYAWAPDGATSATVTGLSVGTYTVTVSDSCGTSGTASVTINSHITLSLSIDSISNIYCNGDTNGSASVLVSGGEPQYTYSWSGGKGTNVFAYGLSAGTYTVTVTDSCGSSATAPVSITQPATALTATSNFIPTKNDSCTGKAWVYASGGMSPYTYLWSISRTTDTITHLCNDIYCCTITDASGCTATICDTINISDLGIPGITSKPSPITVYPNPGNGVFNIQWSVVSGQWSVIEVYNVLGEKVYSNYQIIESSNYQINLSSQPNGIYFYRVLQEDGSLMGEGKVVIEK